MSHGYDSALEFHTLLIEQLASRGYIVVSVQHTYDATVSHLPVTNEILPFDADPPKGIKPAEFWPFRRKHIDIRAADLRFVMDLLLGVRNVEGHDFTNLTRSIDHDKVYAIG